ncbi:MAG: histidinol-phosphate transaminase [Xanthomonadales bacterium]|nr:histidinol-phosphate transaminase [Xanthomonadales bacterium]
MLNQPIPRKALDRCPPYVQGQSAIVGVAEPIKLSSNESPFGPSPRAQAAFQQAVGQLHRYPDGGQSALRQVIAERFGIEQERIVCGNGSEELILLTIRAFVDPGDEVLVSENGFVMTRIHALAQGANIVVAAEQGWDQSVDNILACITDKTHIVAIANPNNPTGTYLPASEIRRLHAGLPSNVLLLLDGAYADYVVEPDFDSGMKLVRSSENVIMTRTFSKLYGLAGTRIGWAYTSSNVVAAIQRIRTPFNTNAPAQAAAAAALQDTEFADRVREHTILWRETMREQLLALGIIVPASVTNFLLMQIPEEGGHNALDASRFLKERGILLRPTGVSGPGDCLRVTVGAEHENQAFLDCIRQYMQVPDMQAPHMQVPRSA